MKKLLSVTVMLALCILVLAACGECKHDWKKATCKDPKTCDKCGETEGEPKEHEWMDATCEEPKICVNCDETEGDPLTHEWIEATCETPKTCDVCKKTEGDAPTHDWKSANCTEPNICNNCGKTDGAPLGHKWNAATYDAPKTCNECNETEGDPLVYQDLGITETKFLAFLNETFPDSGYSLDYWGETQGGWPIYEIWQGSTYTDIYITYETADNSNKVESIHVCLEDNVTSESFASMGAFCAVIMMHLDKSFELETLTDALTSPRIEDDTKYFYLEDNGYIISGELTDESGFLSISRE